ncbi:LUD domain-containing protein [Kitasatospora atroaurantiaca]|uniref:L-lactate dehydrogenase complex protein LldG n=1 Tax=Kitasatospora atroaurantiaca TaxID=285545 RepID=A0A561F047_9ACTN|nr:LUD domain-containing protein [Kitasatospora atroaurantiaca]TWE21233.1 L-lactate dehydrogenase complex protein LldG [Kitasatospora atroaurantiaca]
MNSRHAVLGRIRAALADVPSEERPEDVPVPRDYRRSHTAPGEDTVTLFAERVADYRATVTRTDRARLPDAVAAALTARGAEHLALPAGFPVELLPAGTWQWHPEPLDVPALDALDGAITLAAAGIAVTGTIVLDTGPGQGRRALTLVPDYHLCIVYAEQIAADVPDALARLDPRRPLTFVSGPSATSDIELDRVEGVHGPRTLDVIVVNPTPLEPRP